MPTQIHDEPEPRFPEQKLPKPGLEQDLEPKPRYEAPNYRAAGKLEGKGADSSYITGVILPATGGKVVGG